MDSTASGAEEEGVARISGGTYSAVPTNEFDLAEKKEKVSTIE